MWLMTNDALLTKDYLFHFLLIRLYFVNRALLVISYIKIIIIDHLFFTCPIAKVIWAVTAKGIGELIMYLHPWLNVGSGVTNGYLQERSFICGEVSAICWAIWKARNKACFNVKKLKNPIEIMCHACALMRFWIGLYAEVDMKTLIKSQHYP